MAVESNVGTVTVGTAVTQVLGNSLGRRVAYYIYNTSSGGQTIYIAPTMGTTAVAGSGIVLAPGAGYADSASDLTPLAYACYGGTVTAVSSAAGGTLAYWEKAIV